MNQAKKMKFSNVITLGFLTLGLFSCNNENEIMDNTTDSQLSEVEVSNLSEWNNETRSSNGIQDEKVLRFRDLDTYRKVLSKLSSMTDEEKTSYFQKIGFDGAFTLLQSANNEADLILDSDDLNYIEAKANQTKKKVVFWNKSVNTNYSVESLSFNSPQFNYSNKVVGPRSGICILGLLPERVGKHFDSTVKNFQSGKCGEARGNQTFKNITVM